MKKIAFTIVIIVCLVNMTCEPTKIPIDSENLLLGAWENPVYTDDKITFKRAKSLPENNYVMSFLDDGKFLERSSGWGATPPLTFSDYEGKWELTENLISFTQNHFPNNYTWKILSLTEIELIVNVELSNQEKDFRNLMNLYNEAIGLISDTVCNDPSIWTYTAFGAKACGGPQGYIAYPKTVNVDEFLNKIEAYTNAEMEYNKKWGVFSTCDLPIPPNSISCENGKPVIVY